jgi:serine protease Do
MEDSPAQQAGLQSGDIIVSFNGTPINRSAELPPLVGRIRPGTTVPVTVIREGKERTLKVKIQELPEEPVQRAAVEPTRNRLNVSVINLTPEQRKQLDVQGVLVEEVSQGPAAQAGIRPGDIIVRLNNRPVNTVAEFEKRVKELPTGKPVPILVQRGEGALFLAITIPEKQ